MEELKNIIYDSKTGLTYELNGDYYLLAGEDDPKAPSIGPWGQRHLAFIKKRQKAVYREMLWNGRLNAYLAEIDAQATKMFERIITQLAEVDNVTETLKAENQMLWIQKMNNLQNIATEIVLSELIYC